jgi:hypothetical protein
MLFIMMQQVQPAFIIVFMQSQQAWIISQHLLSPEVQVTQTPLSVISHLHMPMVRQQQQTIIPFIMQQQLHMLPCIMEHRFCNMPQDIWSSQLQVIFMPPWHFSNFIVQRGTIMGFIVGAVPGPGIVMPVGIVPGIPIVAGFIIVLTMIVDLLVVFLAERPHTLTASPSRENVAFPVYRITPFAEMAIATEPVYIPAAVNNHWSGR